MASRELHTGSISVTDFRCDLKPGDAPFVSMHRAFTIAYVRRGSFAYNARGQSSEFVTGAVLIGQPGTQFACTHEDSFGDDGRTQRSRLGRTRVDARIARIKGRFT